MIDPSKVKVGDTLVAHLKVTGVFARGGVVAVEFQEGSGVFDGTVPATVDEMGGISLTRFAEHIPAPRKIEVGSRVVWRSKSRPGVVAAYERTVVAIGHAQFGDVCVSTPIGTLHIVNEQELEVVD